MQTSDPSNVYLAGTSLDASLAVWRLCDLTYADNIKAPWMHEKKLDSFQKALSWNPNQEGILASGSSFSDNIIRLWDVKAKRLEHTIRCNSSITSLAWRKGNPVQRDNDDE